MNGKEYVGSDELYAEVQRTMRLCAEMNTGYHTEAEVRDCLREITRSEVPDTVRVFTPININYGPGVRFGDDCFLNFGCTLLALGGITIGDGAFIGPHCVLATEYHPEDPAARHTLLYLWTDSSCSWQYYPRHGYEQVGFGRVPEYSTADEEYTYRLFRKNITQ